MCWKTTTLPLNVGSFAAMIGVRPVPLRLKRTTPKFETTVLKLSPTYRKPRTVSMARPSGFVTRSLAVTVPEAMVTSFVPS
jgi:hypothetical protein